MCFKNIYVWKLVGGILSSKYRQYYRYVFFIISYSAQPVSVCLLNGLCIYSIDVFFFFYNSKFACISREITEYYFTRLKGKCLRKCNKRKTESSDIVSQHRCRLSFSTTHDTRKSRNITRSQRNKNCSRWKIFTIFIFIF